MFGLIDRIAWLSAGAMTAVTVVVAATGAKELDAVLAFRTVSGFLVVLILFALSFLASAAAIRMKTRNLAPTETKRSFSSELALRRVAYSLSFALAGILLFGLSRHLIE